MNPLVITIDGPAAAGKSTTARAVAARLGCLYLDSGAMYRAFALKWTRRGEMPLLSDGDGIGTLAKGTHIAFTGPPDAPVVVLDGQPVGNEIRTPAISEAASRVAAVPAVRRRMSELQRALAASQSLVAEGRDMGTVLFPDAAVKIFLEASLEERARRRHREWSQRGEAPSLDSVRADIESRDRRDRERDLAPLRPATDALVIDTTGMSVEEQIDAVLQAVEARVGPRRG